MLLGASIQAYYRRTMTPRPLPAVLRDLSLDAYCRHDARRVAFGWAPILALFLFAAPVTASATPALKREKAALAAHNLATHHYTNNEFKKATALYLQAYKIDPKPSYLFNIARSNMRDFQHDQAERYFNKYLACKGIPAKGVERAKLHLAEIAAYRKRIDAVKASKPGKDGLTVGLWLTSAVLVAAGGSMYAIAYSGRLNTNDRAVRSPTEVNEVLNDQESQSTLRWAGVGVAAGGFVAASVALYRTLSGRSKAPSSVSVWANPRGFGLSGRF